MRDEFSAIMDLGEIIERGLSVSWGQNDRQGQKDIWESKSKRPCLFIAESEL